MEKTTPDPRDGPFAPQHFAYCPQSQRSGDNAKQSSQTADQLHRRFRRQSQRRILRKQRRLVKTCRMRRRCLRKWCRSQVLAKQWFAQHSPVSDSTPSAAATEVAIQAPPHFPPPALGANRFSARMLGMGWRRNRLPKIHRGVEQSGSSRGS